MDFKLTEEQSLIKQSIYEFISELKDASVEEILKSMAENDFMGIFFDEEAGGAGADFTSYIVALEEIAKASPSAALAYAINNTQVAYALNEFASETLKEKYLTKLNHGEVFGAYAYSEQNVGNDLLSIETNAERKEDGYVLNGTKTFVLNGGESDIYIVYANTEKGLSAFIVEKGTEGLSITPPYRKMGLDGLSVSNIILEDVKIPLENLIGNEGEGKGIEEKVRHLHSISLAIIAVAISEKALDMSISYGKERTQFRTPIINFDAIKTKVGEMAASIEASKLLTYKAAACKDEGEDFIGIATMARYFAINNGENITREAIQIHGGYGYSKDLGVESLYRDMKGLNIVESLSQPLVLQVADQRISSVESH